MSHLIKGYLSPEEASHVLHQHAHAGAEHFRFILAARLMHLTKGIVQHGPLAGFNLGTQATWRATDNSAKLLGFYEKEVCDLLVKISGDRDVLIDLGGADGFFAAGCVKAQLFGECHCYELNDQSRANIAAVAALNGVENCVHLYGVATSSFARDLV